MVVMMERPMAKKKAPTAQIRISLDVIELAWKCAPHHGYRGGGAAGDYLSDLLRPILLADEATRHGQAQQPPKRRPKGGE
jgi:hypothetical protein